MAAGRSRSPNGSESQDASPATLGKRKSDECKRRKVKCDGQVPCQRCVHNPSACIYLSTRGSLAQRQEKDFKTLNDKMEKLQEQIEQLISNANIAIPISNQQSPLAFPHPHNTRIETEAREPNRNILVPRSSSRSRQPEFLGPTSSTFLLGVAANSLERAGIHAETSSLPDRESSDTASVPVLPEAPWSIQRQANPLLKITRNEALRLIDLYEEECGSVYPFIEKALICKAAHSVYERAALSSSSSLHWSPNEENKLSDGIGDILKLVVAIALVIEGQGPSKMSSELLESVESGFHSRLCGATVDLIEIQAWTAMSVLQFHCDEEVLAWRTIGLAGRAAIELGLHRREIYSTKFRSNHQRLWANRLFWCIYVLDRRWSFGTGRSFAIPDHDIDPDLPEPVSSPVNALENEDLFRDKGDPDSYLLKKMVTYAHIGSKVWKATSKIKVRATEEKLSFLDFQVQQWYDSITPQLRLQPNDENMLGGRSRTQNRIRVLLYLRTNQMRLFIFRRTLLSPKTVNEDIANASRAVNAAKDNIRLLEKVNRTADIYSAQQPAFNYFLVSALAILLLAVCHAPSHFNATCQKEFSMALNLVRGFSCKSYIGKKLWKKVQHLKDIGPKLGILPGERQGERQHGNSFPSPPTQGFRLSAYDTGFPDQFSISQQPPYLASTLSPFDEPLDPNILTDELTKLFATVQPGYKSSMATITEPEIFDPYNHEATEGFSRNFLDIL